MCVSSSKQEKQPCHQAAGTVTLVPGLFANCSGTSSEATPGVFRARVGR
jgi:hypothetical protein